MAKYKSVCDKIAYRTEQEAWEHVIYFKRRGYSYQSPYRCPSCHEYHLTRKHFQGKVPFWVKEYAARPATKELTKPVMLPISKQKELLAQLNNKPRLSYRIKRFLRLVP